MARRTNGEGSAKWVTKNGVKYWRITITTGYDPLTGKQLRKDIYGKTQKEAKEKLKVFQESNTTHSDNSTLGNFFYEWLWNIKKQELKPSTFDRLEGIYRNYIKPTKNLNNAKLNNIDTLYLQKITNKLLEDHTVNQVKNLNKALSTCLKYAVSINKIKNNPVVGIVYPKNHEVIEDKIHYITESEQRALIKALQSDKAEGIILLGLMCGMRLGEAMALQESDIDFDNRVIKINKSVKLVWTGEKTKDNKRIYKNRVTIPKTKTSIREVPFPSILVPLLKGLIKKNKESKLKYGELYFDNKLIFCKEHGEYIDNKQPNRRLKATLKRAGIDADIHFHSLRHIFITNCISNDVNIKTVMDWVGHADINVTMKIYAEINKEKNLKEYDKINSMFK